MKKYSTYKPSNVEWLGDVPSHWKVTRLINRTVRIVGGDWGDDPELESDEHVLLPVIRVQDIDNEYEIGDQKLTYRKIKASKIDHRLIDSRTLLIEKSGGGEKQLVGRVAIPKKITMLAICSNFMEKIEMDEQAVPSFFNYIFHALYNQNMNFPFVQQTTGIQNLKSTYYFYTKVTYPNTNEQTAIASYLDQATANIDKVIATKQKQLEKLEQYKQSKIHECVTKGIPMSEPAEDGGIPMKPSGIDWIGNVPAHWKVERLKDVCSDITSGGTPKTSVEEFWDGEIIWLSPTDFQDFENSHYINNSRRRITDIGLNECSASILPIGTVIMQSRASIGAVKISSVELCTNQGFINFVTSKLLNNRYLFYLIDVYLGYYFANVATGTTFMEMSRTKAKQEKIPLPEIQEQIVIADFLDSFCNKISKEKTIIEQQIEKLKQYRKCLIHECVTGKRKVVHDE